MKPIILKLWTVMTMFCLSISTFAYDFEVDGIYYEITSFTDLTVCATSLSSASVSNIEIPKTVEYKGKVLRVASIGMAFAANNSELSSIAIKADIESIPNDAFKNCTSLKLANISTVKRISNSAFSGCGQLSEVIVSDSLNRLGAKAFYGCIELEVINLPKTITVLGEGTFQNCKKINHIDISNVESIPENTFYGCNTLNDIVLSEKLTSIGSAAFLGCAFDNFKIPNSVVNVGGSIFSECQNLKSVEIGNGITTLSYPLFKRCPKLETLSFSDGDNPLQFLYTTGDAKFTSPHNSNYYSIKAFGCFEGTDIKHVYIGRNLKCGIAGHKTYSVPFLGNKTIETITIGPKVSNIPLAGMDSWGEYIGESQGEYIVGFFQDCTNLRTVKILGSGPNKLTDQIFQGCNSLQEISFGYNLSTIGANAFENCNSLSKLYFYSENAPTYSGTFINDLYINCHIFVPTGSKGSYQSISPWCNFWNLDEDPELIATFTVDRVRYEVLDDNNVQIIGTDLNEISDIVLSRDINYKGKKFILTNISNAAFSGNRFIKSIIIPNCIDVIHDNQFKGCVNLETIILPEGIRYIGDESFQECKKLVEVNIPSAVKVIGANCFSGCSSLPKIDLSACQIDRIYSGTFENCSQLCSIKFPLQEFSIGTNAFLNCRLLSNVDLKNVILIGNAAFYNCESIETLILPESCRQIGNGAFINCRLLSDVDLKNVILIGDEAFCNCESIETIIIPGSCKQIGDGAFDNLKKLTALTFEEGNSSLKVGKSNSLTLDYNITPFPNPSNVDEKRTGFRNGYYDGLFYGLPIERLIIKRDIELSRYYERRLGYSTSNQYSTVYFDITNYPPFYGLNNLKYVEIGETVSSICKNQIETVINATPIVMEYTNFGECDNIEVVISNNSVAPIGGGFSKSVYDNATLFLPNGGESSYTNDDYWKLFSHIDQSSYIPVSSVEFESEELTLDFNETKTLEPIINPDDASIKRLKWSSSNPYIVEVTDEGIIRSLTRKGEAIITASTCDASAITAQVKVVVKEGAGISDISCDTNLRMFVENGKIYILGKSVSDIVEVFNIQGQLIHSSKDSIIELNTNGVFILKIGSLSTKVII